MTELHFFLFRAKEKSLRSLFIVLSREVIYTLQFFVVGVGWVKYMYVHVPYYFVQNAVYLLIFMNQYCRVSFFLENHICKSYFKVARKLKEYK